MAKITPAGNLWKLRYDDCRRKTGLRYMRSEFWEERRSDARDEHCKLSLSAREESPSCPRRQTKWMRSAVRWRMTFETNTRSATSQPPRRMQAGTAPSMLTRAHM